MWSFGDLASLGTVLATRIREGVTEADKEAPIQQNPEPEVSTKIESNTKTEDTKTQSLMDKMRSMEVVSDDEDDEEDSDSEDENTQKILEEMRQKIEQIHDEEDN